MLRILYCTITYARCCRTVDKKGLPNICIFVLRTPPCSFSTASRSPHPCPFCFLGQAVETFVLNPRNQHKQCIPESKPSARSDMFGIVLRDTNTAVLLALFHTASHFPALHMSNVIPSCALFLCSKMFPSLVFTIYDACSIVVRRLRLHARGCLLASPESLNCIRRCQCRSKDFICVWVDQLRLVSNLNVLDIASADILGSNFSDGEQ